MISVGCIISPKRDARSCPEMLLRRGIARVSVSKHQKLNRKSAITLESTIANAKVLLRATMKYDLIRAFYAVE
jgi:hypothetical protein